MKKLVCITMIFCLIPLIAFADVDLSGMSYKELVALKDKINLAMWNSNEWQEVTVTQGLWKVGEDIPEGTWTVKCAVPHYAHITIGDKLDSTRRSIIYTPTMYSEVITSPDSRLYEQGKDLTEISFTLLKGDYISIEDCDVIFTPYTGKPTFDFK